MKDTRLFVVLILIVATGALATRLPRLSQRPMHGDEAVHAVKFNTLWETGKYYYDPNEYHGPTLYYLTLPFVWLSGAKDFGEMSEATFRVVPLVFGVGLILLLLLIGDGLGRAAAVCAGVLTALSPAMVYYGRYYIQEILLVFFTFAAIVAGWRYVRTKRMGWALAGGACLGLMHATKETSIIALGALLAALVVTVLWGQLRGAPRAAGPPVSDPEHGEQKHWQQAASGTRAAARLDRFRPLAFATVVVVSVAVSVVLYSGFFTNTSGPLDSLRAYAAYFDRAGGHGLHDQPWHYYLRMLTFTHYVPGPWWSEALILVLATIGATAALCGKGVRDGHAPLLRFLTLYVLLMTAIYSAIPYKTPWCMLGFLHAMILLAGVGAVALIRWARYTALRVVICLLLLAGGCQLGWQAKRATSFRFDASNYNPYAYAHPVRDVVNLAKWVHKVARVHPDRKGMVIKVIAPVSYWPLPWYLRDFERVGYWETPAPDPDAPVVITTTELLPELQTQFQRDYQINPYGLRPGVTLRVCVDRKLYEAWAESVSPHGAPADDADSE